MQVDQLYQLLNELGLRKIQRERRGNIMACCPFHEENNPSFGVSTTEPHVANCFVCGGFTLEKVVAHCKGFYKSVGKGVKQYDIKRAKEWLREKFYVTYYQASERHRRVRRYNDVYGDDSDEEQNDTHRLPESRIAPFRGGKTTHQMFFDLGFTERTARDYEIGYDRELRRITIPLRWRDGTLAGVLGRSTSNSSFIRVRKEVTRLSKVGKPIRVELREVLPNPRYYVYDNFDRGLILYPLWKFDYDVEPKLLPKKLRDKRVMILCEGSLDALWLHQMGLTNSLALLGSKITNEQVAIIESLEPDLIINMLDNDEAGKEGTQLLIKKMKRIFPIYKVDFPENKKDPRDCTPAEIRQILKTARYYLKRRIRREV